MELKDRIQEIIRYKNVSPPLFAERIGAKTKQSIYDLISGKTKSLSERMKCKITSYAPDINPIWLMTGEGEMLKRIPEKASAHGESMKEYETWLLPMDSHGGSLSGIPADGTLLQNCERVISPIKGVDFAISVYGDSMAPEYPSGSRVLIKRINPESFIEWGRTYVLDTCNGVLIKEVLHCSREGYITCHSINPDPKYADFDIPMADVYGMYRVLMVMAAK